MKLSSKMFDKMKQSAQASFAQLDAGKSGFRVIADMYRDVLPERTEEEAEAMALRIVNQVRNYNRARAAALSDADGWIEAQIDELCEGRTRLERCQLMAQLIDGMLMLSGDASGEFTPGRQARAYTEENVTRQVEAGLRERLSQAVADCGMDARQLGELSDLLDACEVDEAAELVVDFGEKQQDVEAVYAMIAYLNGRNHVRGFDRDLTPEEAAIAVCAASDRLRTAHRVSIGEITAQAGAKILRVIGSVSGFLLDVALCLLVGGAAFMTLYALSILMDFGMAVVIAGAAVAAVLAGIVMFSGSVKLGQNVAALPVKIVKGVARLLAKGWKAIANVFGDRIARPMRIDARAARSAEEASAETAAVEDVAFAVPEEAASVDA